MQLVENMYTTDIKIKKRKKKFKSTNRSKENVLLHNPFLCFSQLRNKIWVWAVLSLHLDFLSFF